VAPVGVKAAEKAATAPVRRGKAAEKNAVVAAVK
jgi:hypothetical protein